MLAWSGSKPVIVFGIISECGTLVPLMGSQWFLAKFCDTIVPGALIFFASEISAVINSEYHEFTMIKSFFNSKRLMLENKHKFIKELMDFHEWDYQSYRNEYNMADKGISSTQTL